MATARLGWVVMLAPAFVAGGALSGCSSVNSPTELAPEGPPMVRQVFMQESFEDPPGSNEYSTRLALAYGTHPEALVYKHKVQSAVAFSGQHLRVVMDELLVGNYLEEIACRGLVDDDIYSPVPIGATPDDIVACAGAADTLPTKCKGDHAVCLQKTPQLCLDDGSGSFLCPTPGVDCADEGSGPVCHPPVGVLDEDQDGASDDTQFIKGAVGIKCKKVNGGNLDVPLDIQSTSSADPTTYWQPSGNQQVPAAGGLEALGPAIVIQTTDGLPTGTTCSIYFSDRVVDKGGNTVCAPQWGAAGAPDETDWPPAVPCEAGNTDDIQFTIEPLRVVGGFPVPDGTTVNYPKALPLNVSFNAKIDIASFASMTITPAPAMTPTAALKVDDPTQVEVTIPGGLAPTTVYTLHVPAPADLYGGPLPAAYDVQFTTGS